MPRQTGPQTVRSLLEASQAILAEEGLSKLTLDAVVARANLTKGALLHHFKSKDALALRLMQESIRAFDAWVEEIRGDDRSPGSYTRAYIRAALDPPPDEEGQRLLQALAVLARDAKLRDVYAEAITRWSRLIEKDGLDPVRAQLLRMAADGVWLHETAHVTPLGSKLRTRLAALMLSMAE